ncbi:MAG: anthranilate phosphoribosyltransferase [Syntrophales bacterium]|jgi:anthranilate phosphoribosyltransferase|nr:anthranilate phosphoribosyltransferase [Syntrophales bacterium]
MIREAIAKVAAGENLGEREMMDSMKEIMEGAATPAQIAAFITALRIKGETVEELTGAARVMRQKATRIDPCASTVVDTCGTGGDGRHTFNISTTAALVVAGAGLTVAKHGNRAVSSSCGSADVLEAMGVNIAAPPEIVEECIREAGIGFLFAQGLHSAMKHAAGPRREIGIRTIFNMLGPLTNPAGATAQLLGVFDARLTEMFAGVLRNLGTRHAFVVYGSDGLDEATVTGKTRVTELQDGLLRTFDIDAPEIFGDRYDLDSLRGGDAARNAEIAQSVLMGDGVPAARNVVLLNAALAIMAGDKAATLQEGLERAKESIDSGAALQKLRRLVEVSKS